jgi:hypothetical protein
MFSGKIILKKLMDYVPREQDSLDAGRSTIIYGNGKGRKVETMMLMIMSLKAYFWLEKNLIDL